MKSINQYISEKLIVNKHTRSKEKQEYNEHDKYLLMKILQRRCKITSKFDDDLDKTFNEVFNSYPWLKNEIINYINNHDDLPEMLDETNKEIYGYLKDLPEDEFSK